MLVTLAFVIVFPKVGIRTVFNDLLPSDGPFVQVFFDHRSFGMDINAVIVAVMGVGIGIDYGIYLLSCICEEFNAQNHNLEKAINAALTTVGKAIMFTATVVLMGILPWHFLSDLKFMADMGLLLVAIMLINMVLSLLALPTLVWFIKPVFLSREDLIIGESVDISKFSVSTAQTL